MSQTCLLNRIFFKTKDQFRINWRKTQTLTAVIKNLTSIKYDLHLRQVWDQFNYVQVWLFFTVLQ